MLAIQYGTVFSMRIAFKNEIDIQIQSVPLRLRSHGKFSTLVFFLVGRVSGQITTICPMSTSIKRNAEYTYTNTYT